MHKGTTHTPFDDGFAVKSGKIRVSDPCYKPDTWCAGTFPAKNGTWFASLEMLCDTGGWGNRVAALTIRHESLKALMVSPSEKLGITVGVDSGQCGFYDEGEYDGIPPVDHDNATGRYSEMCALTLGDPQGGVFNCGVVSSSGYGDGSYDLYIQRDENGDAIAARVVFITDDEEEIDDEDEDDYGDQSDDDEEDD